MKASKLLIITMVVFKSISSQALVAGNHINSALGGGYQNHAPALQKVTTVEEYIKMRPQDICAGCSSNEVQIVASAKDAFPTFQGFPILAAAREENADNNQLWSIVRERVSKICSLNPNWSGKIVGPAVFESHFKPLSAGYSGVLTIAPSPEPQFTIQPVRAPLVLAKKHFWDDTSNPYKTTDSAFVVISCFK